LAGEAARCRERGPQAWHRGQSPGA
jgi:hypothetical protein